MKKKWDKAKSSLGPKKQEKEEKKEKKEKKKEKKEKKNKEEEVQLQRAVKQLQVDKKADGLLVRSESGLRFFQLQEMPKPQEIEYFYWKPSEDGAAAPPVDGPNKAKKKPVLAKANSTLSADIPRDKDPREPQQQPSGRQRASSERRIYKRRMPLPTATTTAASTTTKPSSANIQEDSSHGADSKKPASMQDRRTRHKRANTAPSLLPPRPQPHPPLLVDLNFDDQDTPQAKKDH